MYGFLQENPINEKIFLLILCTGSIAYYSTTNDAIILDKANKEISRFLWKDFGVNQVIVLSYTDCMDKAGKVFYNITFFSGHKFTAGSHAEVGQICLIQPFAEKHIFLPNYGVVTLEDEPLSLRLG